MNRNNIKTDENILQICQVLKEMKTKEEINYFLLEILTEAEEKTLSKRWRILNMLFSGKTQREIAKELNVSLCKITRGAAILKNKKSVIYKTLIKEKKNYE